MVHSSRRVSRCSQTIIHITIFILLNFFFIACGNNPDEPRDLTSQTIPTSNQSGKSFNPPGSTHQANTDNEIKEIPFVPSSIFTLTNTGNQIIHNPRIFGNKNYDLSSLSTLTKSMVQQMPLSSSREDVLLNFWKLLSARVSHLCSPGRNGTFIINPLSLLRDYSYGCCSFVNRAMVILANYLNYSSVLVTTALHEYPEVYLNSQWQILDADLHARWIDGRSGQFLSGISSKNSIVNIFNPFLLSPDSSLNKMTDERTAYYKNVYSSKILNITNGMDFNYAPVQGWSLYPGDSLSYNLTSKYPSIRHDDFSTAVWSLGEANLTADYLAGREGVSVRKNGSISTIETNLPHPLLSFQISALEGVISSLKIDGTAVGVNTKKGWQVSMDNLTNFPIDRNIKIEVFGTAHALHINWIMQFSPYLLTGNDSNSLTYRDDTGSCKHEITLNDISWTVGHIDCSKDPEQTRPKFHTYSLDKNDFETSRVVQSLDNLTLNTIGVYSVPDELGSVTFQIPRRSNSNMLIRVIETLPLTWSAYNGVRWLDLKTTQFENNSWINIPDDFPYNENGLQLRATMLSVLNEKTLIVDSIAVEDIYSKFENFVVLMSNAP